MLNEIMLKTIQVYFTLTGGQISAALLVSYRLKHTDWLQFINGTVLT